VALRRNCGAAFAALNARGEETLVVVQEVERTQRHAISVDDIEGTIREAVVTEHDCAPDHVVLLRPGGIPKTTSGKIQRRLTRQLWEQARLDVLEPDPERRTLSASENSPRSSWPGLSRPSR
jgi:acyl-CoA synthetase (AMP-forming)/AMP-acid ligase II